MFIHVFAFQWSPGVDDTQKAEVASAIRAFQGEIPGLLSTSVGTNLSPRSRGYDFGGVMHFSDRAAFEAYNIHPLHQQLISWLRPLIEPVELDLEA